MSRIVVCENEVDKQQAQITLGLLKQVARKGRDNKLNDLFWSSRYIYRPLSIYLTWIAVRLRIAPGLVTLFGALCLFGAAICYATNSNQLCLIGSLLVFTFVVADHADGEVVRFERWRKGDQGDRRKEFFDTCAHAGETAIVIALAFRFLVQFDSPMWLLVTTLLYLFPGSIGPWRRYCETIVKQRANFPNHTETRLTSKELKPSSLVTVHAASNEERPSVPMLIASHIGRTLGSPDYLLTLVLCSVLDAWAVVPKLQITEHEIPYLLIWLISTSLYHAAASIKSIVVYSQRLKSLAQNETSI